MTEEEMAEEYFKSVCKDYNEEKERTGERHYWVGFDIKNAYLAGLKAGKPKWHKVADGDLPKEEAEYLVIFESDRTKYTGLEIYYPDIEEWSTICTIVAWCEIPKYTEE